MNIDDIMTINKKYSPRHAAKCEGYKAVQLVMINDHKIKCGKMVMIF